MFENFETNSDLPVLILGAASIDIVGRVQGELQSGTSNPAHIRTTLGGTARNVAENVARLGQPVILLSAVGEGNLSEQMLSYTQKAGVNIDHVIRSSDHPTGSYLAMVNAKGELLYALDDMRVTETITPEYLQENRTLFKNASLLYMDANLPPESMARAIEIAKEANLPICADPTSTSLATRFLPHLADIYLMTPNSIEAEILGGQSLPVNDRELALAVAKNLVSQGVNFAIVTLAEFGLSYATSDTSGHIPAIRTRIIDPTGGGDALSAAVIFALLNNIPPDEAVRLGIAAASLTLRHPGAVHPDLSLEMLYDHLAV